jgi:hypothetical protein
VGTDTFTVSNEIANPRIKYGVAMTDSKWVRVRKQRRVSELLKHPDYWDSRRRRSENGPVI